MQNTNTQPANQDMSGQDVLGLARPGFSIQTVRGISVDATAAQPENGFYVEKTANNGWRVAISMRDVLFGPMEDGAAQSSRWPAVTLVAELDDNLNVLFREVVRSYYQPVEAYTYKVADKVIRAQMQGNMDGSTASTWLEMVHEFGFALHNGRLSSPRMIYDQEQKKYSFSQGTGHRISGRSDFSAEQMVREIVRWVNSVLTDMFFSKRVPLQWYNQAVEIITPLGVLGDSYYRVEDVQRALNSIRQRLMQARVDLGITGAQQLEASDIRLSYLQPEIGKEPQGNVTLGQSYARFMGASGVVNRIILAAALTFGYDFAATDSLQEAAWSNGNTQGMALEHVYGLYESALRRLVNDYGKQGGTAANLNGMRQPGLFDTQGATQVTVQRPNVEEADPVERADAQQAQPQQRMESQEVQTDKYGTMKLPTYVAGQDGAAPSYLEQLSLVQRMNDLELSWKKFETKMSRTLRLVRSVLVVSRAGWDEPIEISAFGNSVGESREQAARLALAHFSADVGAASPLLDENGQEMGGNDLFERSLKGQHHRLVNTKKGPMFECQIGLPDSDVVIAGVGTTFQEAYRNAILETIFEQGLTIRGPNQEQQVSHLNGIATGAANTANTVSQVLNGASVKAASETATVANTAANTTAGRTSTGYGTDMGDVLEVSVSEDNYDTGMDQQMGQTAKPALFMSDASIRINLDGLSSGNQPQQQPPLPAGVNAEGPAGGYRNGSYPNGKHANGFDAEELLARDGTQR